MTEIAAYLHTVAEDGTLVFLAFMTLLGVFSLLCGTLGRCTR